MWDRFIGGAVATIHERAPLRIHRVSRGVRFSPALASLEKKKRLLNEEAGVVTIFVGVDGFGQRSAISRLSPATPTLQNRIRSAFVVWWALFGP